jgi:hypothetical protein
VRAQKVFCEGNTLKLVFDGSDLDLRLSSSLQDVAVLNGNRAALGVLPFGKFMREVHQLPARLAAVLSEDLVQELKFRRGKLVFTRIGLKPDSGYTAWEN